MSSIVANVVKPATAGNSLMLDNVPSGFLVSTQVLAEDRVVVVSQFDFSAGDHTTYFGGEFTKFRSDTNLIVHADIFMIGFYEGNGAVAIMLNRTHLDYGIAYQYDGLWDSVNQTTLIRGTAYFTASQAAAGRHTMHFGTGVYANGGTPSFPLYCLNGAGGDNMGNGTAEGRIEGYVSTLTVYEVMP